METQSIKNQTNDLENPFLAEWNSVEIPGKDPSFMRNVVSVDYEDFERNVFNGKSDFVKELVSKLYSGDIYILRNAFPPEYLRKLALKCHEIGQAEESKFSPMIDGCPNQHRKIDLELSKNYTYTAVKHSYFFFQWNKDPLEMFDEVNRRWRVFKYLGGFPKDIYEKNIPSDEVVDRIQFAHYPSGGGCLNAHQDPKHNQRTIISAVISKIGEDFETGGIFFMDKDKKFINLEHEMNIGDMFMCYPTVVHGVAPIDEAKKLDWANFSGRWFLGLYSNDSDAKKNRISVTRIELNS